MVHIAISNQTNETGHLDTYVFNYMDNLKCHNNSLHIMKCIYRFGMYAAHALYKRPPYAIESRWPSRVRGMYAVHTPLAPWIRHVQVIIRDIIRSGIAIHTPYAPHVRHPCAIDTQLIRNTCEIVAPEMFHQTTSAILLRINSFFRTPYKRCGIAGQWKWGISGRRRLTARSREVSNSRDSGLGFTNRSEIWQAPRQQCCRDACQISERH